MAASPRATAGREIYHTAGRGDAAVAEGLCERRPLQGSAAVADRNGGQHVRLASFPPSARHREKRRTDASLQTKSRKDNSAQISENPSSQKS